MILELLEKELTLGMHPGFLLKLRKPGNLPGFLQIFKK